MGGSDIRFYAIAGASAEHPGERAIAKGSFDHFRAYYAAHEADAKSFLNEGERKPDPAVPQAVYAAMTMLTSQLFNLDEALNK